MQILLIGRPELVLYKVATVRTKYFVVNIHPHLFNNVSDKFGRIRILFMCRLDSFCKNIDSLDGSKYLNKFLTCFAGTTGTPESPSSSSCLTTWHYNYG